MWAPPRVADPWGARASFGPGTPWPERIDLCLEDGVTEDAIDSWVESACVLCSTGCGLQIGVKDGRIAGVRGRPDDRVNHGRLGPKGLYGWQANNATDRLTKPLVRGSRGLMEADWETAMGMVVERA